MKFDQIDEEATVEQTLENDAREYESRAIMLQYEALRQGIVQSGGTSKVQQRVAANAAKLAREEADAFIAAWDVPESRVAELKLEVVNGLITNIEQQYVQARTRLQVREDAGLATANHDKQMAELEVLKRKVESDLLAPLAGNREDKRAAARSRRSTKKAAPTAQA